MIIYWKNHLAGFTGAHTYLSNSINRNPQIVSVTTAAPTNVMISQSRSISRFVSSRVFGRVN